MSLIAYPNKWF